MLPPPKGARADPDTVLVAAGAGEIETVGREPVETPPSVVVVIGVGSKTVVVVVGTEIVVFVVGAKSVGTVIVLVGAAIGEVGAASEELVLGASVVVVIVLVGAEIDVVVLVLGAESKVAVLVVGDRAVAQASRAPSPQNPQIPTTTAIIPQASRLADSRR